MKRQLNISSPTASGLRQFCQPQEGVVAGNGFEGDVAMPSLLTTLLLVEIKKSILVNLLGLLRADHADLVVFATQAAARVAHWMNVKLGRLGFASELPKTLG